MSDRGLAIVRLIGRLIVDGRGEAFDSSVEVILPDGSALSPDASWVSASSMPWQGPIPRTRSRNA